METSEPLNPEDDFVTWLRVELAKRGMRQADLAKRGGLKPPTITRVMKREGAPTAAFCKGVARALDLSEIEVMSHAGVLEGDSLVSQIMAALRGLSQKDKLEVLEEVNKRKKRKKGSA